MRIWHFAHATNAMTQTGNVLALCTLDEIERILILCVEYGIASKNFEDYDGVIASSAILFLTAFIYSTHYTMRITIPEYILSKIAYPCAVSQSNGRPSFMGIHCQQFHCLCTVSIFTAYALSAFSLPVHCQRIILWFQCEI